MSDKRCGTCAHAQIIVRPAIPGSGVGGDGEGREAYTGLTCRRYPPAMKLQANEYARPEPGWPSVSESDWCSEWAGRIEGRLPGPCPDCNAKGGHWEIGYYRQLKLCGTCDGTGRVPAPHDGEREGER